MDRSIILQVDESTKGLVEEVQSGISSAIENSIDDVKHNAEHASSNTDLLLSKFKKFDGLHSSLEQLKTLADESHKFVDIATPLKEKVEILQGISSQNVEALEGQADMIVALTSVVSEISESQKDLNQKLLAVTESNEKSKSEILSRQDKLAENIANVNANASQNSNAITALISQLRSDTETIKSNIASNDSDYKESIDLIKAKLSELESLCHKNEEAGRERETALAQKLQATEDMLVKLQATLDIVVNIVTPFYLR